MVNLAYFAFVLRVTAVTAAMGQSAAATTYTYQAIAVPQAYETWVASLSDDGAVVGYYWDINYRTRGFLMKNGVYTNIDGPGLLPTMPTAINNKGDVIGNYSENSSDRGFLLHNGKLTTIAYQTAAATILVAINDAGIIAGNWFDKAGRPHPFLDDHGILTTIPVDPAGTQQLALAAKNVVAGTMKRHGALNG